MNALQNHWVINRIGLLNFWYYDEEEFNFNDGRLLLRGSNGSGKSVTMQSFIPLLLDGNKSAERLDPFGSRARRLENYLLGEDEKDKEESTAYLFMEFCKGETDHYLTIGMGLRARRGKQLDFWGFSITDGRRIGQDLRLYKETGEKIPLSKIELRNRIGSGGELYEGQKDYMSMVNRLLFGFETIEDYDELIKLLIQIRTPKLSKDFKPTVVYEIMNNSLQPLSDDDLRPMSEAIENMDNIKGQLEVLKESKAAADRLMNEYERYNRFVLLEKARYYVNSQDKLDTAKKDLTRLESEGEDYHTKYVSYEQEHEDLKLTRQSYEHKKQQLEKHDSFIAQQEITRLEALLQDLQGRKETKEKSLDGKKTRERQLSSELKALGGKQEEQAGLVESLLSEMDELANRFYFYEHAFTQAELQKDLSKDYDFRLLRNEIDRYKEKISRAKKVLEREKTQSQQYDRALEELEGARQQREGARRELDRTEAMFEETKEEFIEQVYGWEKKNKLLKLPAESMVQVSRAVQAFGKDSGYDNITREVHRCHRDEDTGIRKNILEIEAAKAEYNKEKEQKQADLDDWKSRREPEPETEDKLLINRQRLDKENIPYIPFYRAIDFRDEVEDKVRGRIEEALMDMGLLNALIVPEKYRELLMEMEEDTGEKYIFPNPQFYAYELSTLLKPVAPEAGDITAEEIDDALKSIMLDKQEGLAYLNESGEFGMGILNGKTTSCYTPKFIGVEARKRHKLEKIQELEQQIEAIDKRLEQEEQKISLLETKLVGLNAELDDFPGKVDLETAYEMVYSARLDLESKLRDFGIKEDYAEKAHHALKEIREQVRELTAKSQITVNLEAYEEADQDAAKYRDMLGILETQHVRLVQFHVQADSNQRQIDDIIGDMDDILYDINKINWDMQDAQSKKQNHEALLKELNYEEIKNEVDECIRVLSSIPKKIEEAIRNAQTCKEKHNVAIEKMNRLQEDVAYLVKLNACYGEGFRKEYGLAYVVKYENNEILNPTTMTNGQETAETWDVLKAARKAYHDLKGEEKEGKLREDYASALQERYHQNRQYFTEYNLIMEFIFDWDHQKTQGLDDSLSEDDRLIKAVSEQKRMELSARIQGRDVNFYSLVGFIQDSIEENEKLLRESDRQLFEDILANTVGKKIRGRIYHSEQWVKKMNSLMESMDTSSGLSFSLVWRSRTAETEDQMGTKELVDILKSDAGLLREEDMEKLASHFRSKIAQARKELEGKGAMQTFHAIMKDILDYRKWFEFQLFYKKTGETRKELTNNAFDKFSGGEKGMAMYVPLFSAVYARYEGGRKDCPRIISLDEAFAGVDENNIRDMFRLMDELQLSFIINSQILWGDYDTVPALSICELVRPNNADFVTVIRYRWNGKVRELVVDDEDMQDAGKEVAASML